MDATADRKLRPLLTVFQLRTAEFSNNLKEKTSFRIRMKEDISVEVVERKTTDAIQPASTSKRSKKREPKNPIPFRGVASINIEAEFETDTGEKLNDISASASYLARFSFSKDADINSVKRALEEETYQYQFVAQAFPLAMNHFKDQLNKMGLSTNTLPSGIA